MKYIYLGVNYDSSEVLKNTLKIWGSKCEELGIYIVDNFSTEVERSRVKEICKKSDAKLIINENNGYGAALNLGIRNILNDKASCINNEETFVFFGNVDVAPNEKVEIFNSKCIPVLKIENRNKNQNPFLLKAHLPFLSILCLAAKLESIILYNLWRAIYRSIKILGGKTVAVHGSLFCLNLKDLEILHPIFNENVFLYCEELFFFRKTKMLNKNFENLELSFNHIGSVSTSKTIKKDREKFFKNWSKSMRVYCSERL